MIYFFHVLHFSIPLTHKYVFTSVHSCDISFGNNFRFRHFLFLHDSFQAIHYKIIIHIMEFHCLLIPIFTLYLIRYASLKTDIPQIVVRLQLTVIRQCLCIYKRLYNLYPIK